MKKEILYLCVLCFSVLISMDASSQDKSKSDNKYKDYEFRYSVIDFENTPETSRYIRPDVSSEDQVLVNEWFSKYYKISTGDVFNYGGLGIWYLLQNNVFVIGGEFKKELNSQGIETILFDKCVSASKLSGDDVEANCNKESFLAVLDLNNNKIEVLPHDLVSKENIARLNNEEPWDELKTWRNKKHLRFLADPAIGTLNQYPHPDYGCMAAKHWGRVDIDLDGTNELMIISSGGFDDFGAYRGTSNRSPDYTYSYFYVNLLKFEDQGYKFLLDQELVAKEVQYGSKTSLQSIDGSDGNGGGRFRKAKLFFGDYDNDGQLEMIAWRKLYTVKYLGWKETLNQHDQEFQRFVLKDNNKFQSVEIMSQNVDDIVREYDLEWEKGFPEKGLCE